ncbi:tyrosine-type recombinase/integrase [Endozoicomonas sp.]|uniref:tyrosine-type recombinase/integrase n=1 Tax=Endozoicomonas sp. TaxID=1892382 RepID=UPI00383A82DC
MKFLNKIKRPKGLIFEDNKKSFTIRLSFIFQGVRCKEQFLRRNKPSSNNKEDIAEFERKIKKEIKIAENKLGQINHEICLGVFSYSKHFPGSNRVGLFEDEVKKDVLVKKLLEDYEEVCLEGVVAYSSSLSHSKTIRGILIPSFGDILIKELNKNMIRKWSKEKSKTIKSKTIKNYLSILKLAIQPAVDEKVIPENPLLGLGIDSVLMKDSMISDFEVNPFSIDEIEIILEVAEGQDENLFQTAFFTGLRTSEIIGLKWSKVDFENRVIKIDMARVKGKDKVLKTATKGVRSRNVAMLDQAYEALINQKEITYGASDYVFIDPLNKGPWGDSAKIRKRIWIPLIKRTGLKYRNPYQTRHSYACLMIKNNENVFWIADQMGHTGIEMINRHYGKFIHDKDKVYIPKITKD